MSNGGSLRMKIRSKNVSGSVRISCSRKWTSARSTSTWRTVACGTVRSTKRSGGSQWYWVCPRRWPSSWNANVVSLSTRTRLIGSITYRMRSGPIGGDTSRAARLEPTPAHSVSTVTPAVLAVRHDRDGGGLRAQHARAERDRDEAVRAGEGDLVGSESALGADERHHRLGLRRQLAEPPGVLALPRHHPQLGQGQGDERVERERRVDHRHPGAPRLLRGRHRDAPPALEGCAVPDHVRGRDRRDPLHAELRRLLDDEIHLRSAEQRGGEGQGEGRLAQRSRAGDDPTDRFPPGQPLEDDVVLAARVVEDAQAGARGESQGAQVTELRAGDTDRLISLPQPGDVEPEHQRSSRSVRQGSAARTAVTRNAGNAAATASAWESRRPETTSRPAGATTLASAAASVIRMSARRLATTRSKRGPTAAALPA